MKLEYTEHAELKLKERRISKSEIETILKKPEAVLLDVETGYLVAVGNRVYRQGHRLLVIYSPGEIIKLITVIDTSRTEIIKTREKKGRWVKIK